MSCLEKRTDGWHKDKTRRGQAEEASWPFEAGVAVGPSVLALHPGSKPLAICVEIEEA